jgi:prophage regulatory protein
MAQSLLLDLTGLHGKGIRFSRQHLHRLIRQGLFPRPIKLGKNTNAWLAEEIDAYIAERIADRGDIDAFAEGDALQTDPSSSKKNAGLAFFCEAGVFRSG